MKARLAVSALSVLCCLAIVSLSGAGAGEKKEQDKKDIKDFAEMGKPGPEHKILGTLTGSFSAKVKFWMDPKGEPQQSTGTMNRTLIMGGRFLQENYQGMMGDQKFVGMGLVGYDTHKKKYVSTWIDNMGTGMMNSMGTYNADKKTFTYTSEDDDPYTGVKMKMRDVLRIISEDEAIFEMFRQPSDGKMPEVRVMEIMYSRAKLKGVPVID